MPSNITIETFNSFNKPPYFVKESILDFLYEQLGEYGDPKEHILKAMDYALKEIPSHGGFIIAATEGKKVVGATVVNRTGMSGYIPENILVYIAVHEDTRGQGLGKKIMKEAIKQAIGDIALHVEPQNPAKFLYEKLGFTNKYLEMRYKQRPKDKGTKQNRVEELSSTEK